MIAGLIRGGVDMVAAANMIGTVREDPQLALVLIALSGEPRVGDRVRAKLDQGPPQAGVVVALAEAKPVLIKNPVTPGIAGKPQLSSRRWALVLRPVAPSVRDDVQVGGG